MKKYLSVAVLLLVTGCGGVQLIDESGRAHAGKFDSITKQLEGTIDGKTYKGFYVTNAGAINYSGWIQGTRSAYNTSGQASYSGNAGRAILTAADGDTIQCEFSYSGYRAIGTCQGAGGERYQLVTR